MKNLEIQVLRAIAMIAVLIGHMPIALPNQLLHGYTFVSLFFVISGYFAVVQFNKRHSHVPSQEKTFCIVKTELLNKAFRLLPLMFAWIAISFLIGNITIYRGGAYGDMSRWWGELKSALLFNYNYYLAGLDVGGLFGQYWSLYVEIHFFVFLCCFLHWYTKRRRESFFRQAWSC